MPDIMPRRRSPFVALSADFRAFVPSLRDSGRPLLGVMAPLYKGRCWRFFARSGSRIYRAPRDAPALSPARLADQYSSSSPSSSSQQSEPRRSRARRPQVAARQTKAGPFVWRPVSSRRLPGDRFIAPAFESRARLIRPSIESSRRPARFPCAAP